MLTLGGGWEQIFMQLYIIIHLKPKIRVILFQDTSSIVVLMVFSSKRVSVIALQSSSFAFGLVLILINRIIRYKLVSLNGYTFPPTHLIFAPPIKILPISFSDLYLTGNEFWSNFIAINIFTELKAKVFSESFRFSAVTTFAIKETFFSYSLYSNLQIRLVSTRYCFDHRSENEGCAFVFKGKAELLLLFGIECSNLLVIFKAYTENTGFYRNYGSMTLTQSMCCHRNSVLCRKFISL
ncbi:hypothetical protein EGR_01523 [Echinococcus granulosus]|uniref:Uncharacterized protein n=1 Tax=Echinococcus granulosus TaxID=6210 RepID=W6US17_ECHGR|nr:hypothetical protein EGR_01523 [Echinococcus granulosus]EUB63441.1 hypothetical protein EGR_01523 [Echinococcus granulosus]